MCASLPRMLERLATRLATLGAFAAVILSVTSLAAEPPDLLVELNAGNFAVVDAYLNQIEADYRDGKISEEAAGEAFGKLTRAADSIEPRLDEWLSGYPQSFAAVLIRGMFATNRGGRARGGEYYRDVPPERIQEMHEQFEKARALLTRAAEIDPKSTAEYGPFIRISRILSDREGARRYLDAAVIANPKVRFARTNYMELLHPNWGGGVKEMEAFLAESARTGADEATLKILGEMVAEGKAWPALLRGNGLRDAGDYAAAIAAYTESIAIREVAVAYSGRAWTYNQMEQYAKAIPDVTRALELAPGLAYCCLATRARALIKLGRFEEGIADLTKAVDAGDPWSERTLGVMYASGKDGVKQDWNKAALLCRRAADHGDGLGMYCVGTLYDEGRGGLPRDTVQSAVWFEKAAEKGVADAQTDIGISYWEGQGVAVDRKRAIYWWRRAADQGNERARLKISENLSTWESFKYITLPAWGYYFQKFLAWLGRLFSGG